MTNIEAKSKGCVLAVEDYPNDLELTRTVLQVEFSVETATDGDQGYARAVELVPDCIISDVRMPTMSGFTMLKKIRSNPDLTDIPVILLTALGESADKVHGYGLEADLYLTKPVDTDELLAAVQSLISRRQKRLNLSDPSPAKKTSSGISENDQLFLHKLIGSIHANFNNPKFTVTDLAQSIHVERRQLERRLKKLENITPHEYIRQVRLEEAKKLLDSGIPDSIADLSYRVGFKDAKHFSKIFRSFYGYSPTILN